MSSGNPVGDGPIFVVGSVRSGTTMLRYMLCSHPQIYLTPESNFIPRFFGRRPTGELSQERAGRILDGLKQYKPFWRDWTGVRPDVHDLLPGVERCTPESLLTALYRTYAAQYGALRFGDKTPGYVAHLDLISSIFPRSQIVHIIRDAADVAASSLENYQGRRFFYMDAYYTARSWREQLGRGIEIGRSLPAGRYFEVRYEDLTTHTESALRDVCEFLGEEYHPQMTRPHIEAGRHHHSHGIHRKVRERVTTASAGRWRQDLAPVDQRLVQPLVADLLVEFGYRLGDLGPPSAAERWRTAALRTKYTVVDRGRRALGSVGVANPTRVLRRLPGRLFATQAFATQAPQARETKART